MEEKEIKKEDITCPFCGEKDFDLIGLKYHLSYCEKYLHIDMSDIKVF